MFRCTIIRLRTKAARFILISVTVQLKTVLEGSLLTHRARCRSSGVQPLTHFVYCTIFTKVLLTVCLILVLAGFRTCISPFQSPWIPRSYTRIRASAIALARLLWHDCFGTIAVARWLWHDCCGTIALARLLWRDYSGNDALARLLWCACFAWLFSCEGRRCAL